MIECVVNISEGRDLAVVDQIAAAAGPELLDVHTDPHHNRSVLTLVGEDAPRAVAAEALARLDLRRHAGVHPRIGVVDVAPFVALAGSDPTDAVAARDRFGAWAAEYLGLPGFAYGPERSLPEVRRRAFGDLSPTWGPPDPHPSGGAVAVGARPLLVAYNVWVADVTPTEVRAVAAEVRSPTLRSLGLEVGERLQVSMNLIAPEVTGPDGATDAVTAAVAARGGRVTGCELVGLMPRSVLDAVDPDRWEQLDLGPDRTIESRLTSRTTH